MKRVLMIEDDPSLQDVYKLALEELVSYECTATGKEGLERIMANPPDLILLDIMLPGGLNGFDVLEQLKHDDRTKNIPVIVLTNLDTEEKVAKEIGAVEYLVKANTPIETVIEHVKTRLQI